MKFRIIFLQSLFFVSFLFFGASSISAVLDPQLFKDIYPGTSSQYPSNLFIFNNKMYFSGSDSIGSGLWVSDGTVEETYKAIEWGGAGNYFLADEINHRFFAVARNNTNGLEPWVSDGTVNGTFMLKDIYPGSSHSNPIFHTIFGGKVFFKASDPTNGYELYVSDGTVNGTVMLKDIYPGATSAGPDWFVTLNNRLYFSATDSVNGGELWTSDGTSDGTYMLKDIRAGVSGSSPTSLTILNNKIYFSAYGSDTHYELWTSDGTADGTVLVKDINPGLVSAQISSVNVLNNKIYFSATDGSNGVELWTSDGTVNGTYMVKDIYPGVTGSGVTAIGVYGNRLYFKADDGSGTGSELWTSDGTADGTYLLKDIRPGSTSSNPASLVSFNNKIYFSANDGTNGVELWTSDGTANGTYLVKDIYSGATSSTPQYPLVFDNKLFFRAKTLSYGDELWFISKNSAKNITSFGFSSLGVSGSINANAHTVSLSVPYGTDLSSLIPTINISSDALISPVSGIAQNFTNPVTYTVTAEDGGTQEHIVTVTELAAIQIVPDATGSATLNSTSSELVVSSSTQEINLTVEDETDEPTINVSSLVSSGVVTMPQTTVSTSKASVVFPATTIVTSSDVDWNGLVKVPTVTTVSLPVVSGQTSTVSKAIILGSTTSNLTFNKGVRIILPGDSGKLVSYSQDGVTFTEINEVCSEDSQTAGDALAEGSDCKISVGDDLVVWTKHFTTFVTYSLSNSSTNSDNNSGVVSNSSNNNSESTNCSKAKPVSSPVLFQINAGKNTAELFFTPISNTNNFVISFSTKPLAEEHGEEVTLANEGVQKHTVFQLNPNTNYYFKVRGQNGCVPGEWSNVMKIKTLPATQTGRLNIFYKDQSLKSVTSGIAKNIQSDSLQKKEIENTQIVVKDVEVKNDTQNEKPLEISSSPKTNDGNFIQKAYVFFKSFISK